MERREAQRPTSLAARSPKAATPGNGDIAVGALGGPQGPPGRPRQPAVRGRRSALAPPGAPSPHRGNGKKGNDAPDVAKQPAGGALADCAKSLPFVLAKAGTQESQIRIVRLALDSRFRGNERIARLSHLARQRFFSGLAYFENSFTTRS
jgi:hypothetical protein